MGKVKGNWRAAPVAPRSISGQGLTRRNPELARRLGIVPEYSTRYQPRPTLTQGELGDMVSAAGIDTAILLACTTAVASGSEAEALLRAEGMGHLLGDHAAAVAEVEARRIDLGVVFDVLAEAITPIWGWPLHAPLADVLEAYSMKSLRDWGEMIQSIADGITSWAWLKGVGVSNVIRFQDEIEGLDQQFTGAEVKSLIARAHDKSLLPAPTAMYIKSPRNQLSYLVRAAQAIGINAALELRCPGIESCLRLTLRIEDAGPEAIAFMDDFYSIAHDRQAIASIAGPPGMYGSDRAFLDLGYRYHSLAGVSPEEAIEMALAEITPEQAEGIARHGVATAISGGWL